jgi:putative flippase GtrA
MKIRLISIKNLIPNLFDLFYSHSEALVRFGTVGLLTAILYFASIWLAMNLIRLDYLVAVSMAYIVSSAFHFFANRHFTFGAGKYLLGTQIARYSVMWLINYFITVLIVSICVETLGFSAYVGVCASISTTVFLGYFLSHYWVFKSRELIS